jgi:site-specific recombinase XerD
VVWLPRAFLPISAELRAVLQKTPVQAFTFLTTENGTPYKPGDFSEWFRRQCNAAGLPKHCVPHGLRHAAATRLAEAGASPHQIAAINPDRGRAIYKDGRSNPNG